MDDGSHDDNTKPRVVSVKYIERVRIILCPGQNELGMEQISVHGFSNAFPYQFRRFVKLSPSRIQNCFLLSVSKIKTGSFGKYYNPSLEN